MKQIKNILVIGGNGQLASCIKDLQPSISNANFIFKDLPEFDILNKDLVFSIFSNSEIDYCINCAAYTAVDKAEEDVEMAHKVNVTGVQNLAEGCKTNNTTFIHISTDFVFDGFAKKPYIETDVTNPISVYGSTKLESEEVVKKTLQNYFIIRTSWLYSEHGNNFMKTMIRLGNEREQLGVINDQIGTPTYAKDLAQVLLNIIDAESKNYGLYHYSNDGSVSWFDFAKEIFKQESIRVDLKPIPTTAYPSPAKRPKYSVLDKAKITITLDVEIYNWKASLKQALKIIKP